MAHGYYDYGVSRAVPTVHATPDIAEGAVRQGAVSSVDRRGNVLEYDDFEAATMKWTLRPGVGVVAKSDEWARSGDYSIYLETGAETEDASEIGKSFAYPVPSNLGAEFWFLWDGTPMIIELLVEIRSATGQYAATIRYDTSTSTLEYYDSAGVWQVLETYPFTLQTNVFWPMKLVCNSINNEYVRVLFMEHEYNLTTIPMGVAGPAGTSYITVEIEIETLEDGGAVAYVDDVILTQNEP